MYPRQQKLKSHHWCLPKNANNWGWFVQEEFIYPNSVASVGPLKPVVKKESLRKHISKLQTELEKANDTIARLKENYSKKGKVHGGNAKPTEVLVKEKATEMFDTWQTENEFSYKEQIRSLNEAHARHMVEIEKLEKNLAEEKAMSKDLIKDAKHTGQLHTQEVKNLTDRLQSVQKDKDRLMNTHFPSIQSAVPSRRVEMVSTNQFTPEFARGDSGQKRFNPPGSGDSP